MTKKPITWLELINQKLGALKKEGKSASIGDVAQEAKAEWTKIKAGLHPMYIQGKAKTHARKHKKDKSHKTQKAHKNMDNDAEIKKILSTMKLCKKCSEKVNKIMKKQKGGSTCGSSLPSPPTEGYLETANIFTKTGGDSPSEDNVETDNVETDNVETDNVETYNVETDNVMTDNVMTDNVTEQKGGDCGCGLTGGKKSKKSSKHSKKSKHHSKKNRK
jgi:hypothetical protein